MSKLIKNFWKWLGKEKNYYNAIMIIISIITLIVLLFGYFQVQNINFNLNELKVRRLKIEGSEGGVEIIPGATTTLKFYEADEIVP